MSALTAAQLVAQVTATAASAAGSDPAETCAALRSAAAEATRRAIALRQSAMWSQHDSDTCWAVGKLRQSKALQAQADRDRAEADLSERFAAQALARAEVAE